MNYYLHMHKAGIFLQLCFMFYCRSLNTSCIATSYMFRLHAADRLSSRLQKFSIVGVSNDFVMHEYKNCWSEFCNKTLPKHCILWEKYAKRIKNIIGEPHIPPYDHFFRQWSGLPRIYKLPSGRFVLNDWGTLRMK